MKYYKDTNNNVYAYESDGSQDVLIGDKVSMTPEEVEAHINPPITLDMAKAIKKRELENDFNVASKIPVIVGARSYNGGKESAQALRDCIQLVTESGGVDYTIWDSLNVISTYTLSEATAIKLAVATAVAQGEFNLRMKKNAVNNATTIEAINVVTY